MKKRRQVIVPIVIGICIISAGYVLWQNNKRVLGVADTQQEKLQKVLYQQEQFFRYTKQDPKQLAYAKRDAQKRIAEMAVIEAYAQKHALQITQSEIEHAYTQEIARSKKSEDAYLAQLNAMYGVTKVDHLAQIREELLKQRVQEQVHKPLVTWLKEQK